MDASESSQPLLAAEPSTFEAPITTTTGVVAVPFLLESRSLRREVQEVAAIPVGVGNPSERGRNCLFSRRLPCQDPETFLAIDTFIDGRPWNNLLYVCLTSLPKIVVRLPLHPSPRPVLSTSTNTACQPLRNEHKKKYFPLFFRGTPAIWLRIQTRTAKGR